MGTLSSAPRALRSCLLAVSFSLAACASPVASASPPPGPASSASAPPAAPSAPTAALPARTGPADADVRPGPRPVDVKTLTLAPDVHRDWLALDSATIWKVRSLLPPGPSVSALFHALGASGKETTDLGFGVARHQATVGGGYSSCTLTAVANADALLALRIECSSTSDGQTLTSLRSPLERLYGAAFAGSLVEHRAALVARVDYAFPVANAAARGVLDRKLGAQQPVADDSLAPELLQPYQALLSPVDALAVGTSCGIAGQTPAGLTAVTALQSANRVDLLRNVLRGPSPEGRIYAARALQERGAMSPDDAAIVTLLLSDSAKVETCSGCIFMRVPPKEALQGKR